MSKRRVKRNVTYIESDSDSDYALEDRAQRPAAPRAKRKRTAGDADDRNANGVEMNGRATKHALSLHTIANPKPLQSALLDWYGTVHEKRGMPWRKPFVSTSDKRVRSQRAYEVCAL